jgi:hypothetical protein
MTLQLNDLAAPLIDRDLQLWTAQQAREAPAVPH